MELFPLTAETILFRLAQAAFGGTINRFRTGSSRPVLVGTSGQFEEIGRPDANPLGEWEVR